MKTQKEYINDKGDIKDGKWVTVEGYMSCVKELYKDNTQKFPATPIMFLNTQESYSKRIKVEVKSG